MGIVDEDIERVREATDFVAIVSEHLGLKRVGRRWVGLCPFHAEKTPSFSVNAEEKLWYCFGCQAKGDAITFVRELLHLDFVEAVEHLAHKAGIQVRYDEGQSASRERQRKARLQEVLERAVTWYHERLLSAPDAAAARSYLRSRGYDGEIVRRYQLGWAPDDWDALSRALRQPDDVMTDAGLAFVNRRRRQQDVFRGRILFPIFDTSGKPVAFGGRILPGTDGPKYKNSAETVLYRKSSTLYGLSWAKADIVSAGEAIVCEGYTDVIGFGQAGLSRAVATCGTALTGEHLRALKSFASRVVFAFDADAAGQAAADRVYEWERAYELDIAVAALPPGSDPADLARTDPDALRKAVETATPFLGFRVDRVLEGADLARPEGRARAAEAALEVIGEHPSELVRDQYVMQVADRVRMEPDRLRARLAGQGSDRSGRGAAPTGRRGGRPEPDREVRAGPQGDGRPGAVAGPELEALRLAVNRPAEVVPLLDEVLFDDELSVAAFRALATSPDLRSAIEAADPGASALLQRLAVEDTEAEAADVVARLAQEAAARAIAEIQREARASDQPLAYAEINAWLNLVEEQLREPEAAVAVIGQLVTWLRDRAEEHP